MFLWQQLHILWRSSTSMELWPASLGHSCERRIDPRGNRRTVRMVGNEPRMTAKEVRAELQDESTSFSDRTICHVLSERVASMEADPGGLHFWKTNIKKKARQEFAQHLYWQATILLLDRCIKPGAFRQVASALCLWNRSFQRKEQHPLQWNMEEAGYGLGLLCCGWHAVPWICAGHNDISTWSRPAGTGCLESVQDTMTSQHDQGLLEQRAAQGQKALSQLQVLQQDSDPKHTS